MAYAIADLGIIEVIWKGTYAGQVTMTVMHYQSQDAITEGRAAIVDALQILAGNGAGEGAMREAYLDCCNEGFELVEVSGQYIHPARYAKVVEPNGAGQGTVVSDEAPPNVCAAITRSAEEAGPGTNGTLHIPAVPLAWVSLGRFMQPAAAPYGVFAATLDDTLTLPEGVLKPVIYKRANPALSKIIVSAVPQDTLRTMRRRTVGKGI